MVAGVKLENEHFLSDVRTIWLHKSGRTNSWDQLAAGAHWEEAGTAVQVLN